MSRIHCFFVKYVLLYGHEMTKDTRPHAHNKPSIFPLNPVLTALTSTLIDSITIATRLIPSLASLTSNLYSI